MAGGVPPHNIDAIDRIGHTHAIRIPSNDNLERDIAELITRPVGRPGQKPLVEYKGFLYQAAGWKAARRVVAKVEHHPGELYPQVGFIVTNLTLPSRAVVRKNVAQFRPTGIHLLPPGGHNGNPG